MITAVPSEAGGANKELLSRDRGGGKVIAVQGELWGLQGLKGGGGGRVKPHFGELEGVRGRG